jgi:hypothetical protein
MKYPTTISAVLLLASLCLLAPAASGGPVPRVLSDVDKGDLVEQLLNSAPPKALRLLKDPAKVAEGEKEANQFFGHNFIGKPAMLRIKIEAAGPYSQGPNKYHIRATSAPVKWAGGEMGRLNWFYFNEDKVADASKAKEGEEVVITGIIRRCEVVQGDGGLKINFDLGDCAIVPAASGGIPLGR